jgi:hypothetical protein
MSGAEVEVRDALAMLTQRSAEAEEAWRAHAAAEKRWREAEARLWEAIKAVEVIKEYRR